MINKVVEEAGCAVAFGIVYICVGLPAPVILMGATLQGSFGVFMYNLAKWNLNTDQTYGYHSLVICITQ